MFVSVGITVVVIHRHGAAGVADFSLVRDLQLESDLNGGDACEREEAAVAQILVIGLGLPVGQ